jgi:hypothetical protein
MKIKETPAPLTKQSRKICLLGRQRHIHGQVFQPLCFWPGHKFKVPPKAVEHLTKRWEKRSQMTGGGISLRIRPAG